ncbi:lysophospholipid acyltransferase family protein [Chloroflexus sp.]|uniref:lysophospholipid acyltransferase family protein n=1 Tax=Chloroflexus sp. TaxID=1904827 RepID=UPI002ACDADE2|nr:lysophospholipid acyltransferase family protein [Chloroflexus sp.]
MFAYVVYGLLYIIIHFFRLIGWWRWSIEGVERLPPREQGGMILVMNHINWVDIPAVGALLPFRYRLSWLAKIEIFANPVAGWFFRNMHVIPIRRGKRDLAALDAAAEALRKGAVLLIFPEGHRSRNGILQPGRGGAIRLAMQAGVPIVPMAITGTEHGFRGTLRREPVHIKIGEPYYVEPLPDNKIPADVMERLTTEMMLKIAAMLPPAQRGPYAALLEESPAAGR